MRFLTILVSSDDIAEKLCSHQCEWFIVPKVVLFHVIENDGIIVFTFLFSDSCLFLRLFQYATSHPDKIPTGDQYLKLEIEVGYTIKV